FHRSSRRGGGCVAARCQRAAIPKIPRIGVLWHVGNEEEEALYLGALREGFSELGYVEGKNFVLENRFAAEQYERCNALAAGVVIKVSKRGRVEDGEEGWVDTRSGACRGDVSRRISANFWKCCGISARATTRRAPRSGNPRSAPAKSAAGSSGDASITFLV